MYGQLHTYTHTHKHAHKIALSERMLGVQLLNTQILRWWYDLLRAGQIMEMFFCEEGNTTSSQTRVASRSKTNPRQTAHSSSSLCIHRILGHKQGQALPSGGSSALSFRNPGAGTEPPTCMRL